MSPHKILILSCNTGQGHNSAAAAIGEELGSRGTDYTVCDALGFASERISDFVSGVHNRSAVYAPSLFESGSREAAKQTESGRDSICFVANALYAPKLLGFIEDGGYDAVVATHVFPSEALTYLRRDRGLRLPCYFVATDYDCTPFVGETRLDGYFIPHDALSSQFSALSLGGARVIPSGIPVSKKFCSSMSRREARKAVGISPDGRTALIMTGSMGAGCAEDVAAELSKLAPETDLVVFGGNNSRLKKELRERFGGISRVRVLDYTDNVDVWLDAADVLVTKPGGLSITEAACKGIPLVLSTPLPGWECDNVDFFVSHGMALSGDTPEAQAAAAVMLLSDSELSSRLVASQRQNIPRTAAATICDAVLRDISSFSSI